MTITAKSWSNYVLRLRQLNEKAASLMQTYIDRNGTDDITSLIAYANALVTKYGEGSATLAAQMYDELAEVQNASVAEAVPAEPPNYDTVAKMVKATITSTSAITQGISRLVKQAGADTTLQNAQRDRAQFAWIPHGDTCPFCLMLASNGWRYQSKNAMKNGHASHIHANCDCTYAVRFDSRTTVAGYDPDRYLEQYRAANGDLNAMRRAQYQENKDEINAQKREAYQARKALEEAGAKKITVEGSTKTGNRDKIKTNRLLRYVGKPIIERDNQHVREWYVANVSDIPNQIDVSKPLIDQAKQAYALRTQYKHAARAAMADTETAKLLDKERPALTFEELLYRKMRCKGMTEDDAIKDILETASKTNNNVNKEFGL